MNDTSIINDDYLNFEEQSVPENKNDQPVISSVEDVENYQEFEIQVNTYRFYKKQSSSE